MAGDGWVLNAFPMYAFRPKYVDYIFTSSTTFAMPRGAKVANLTVVSGGGGGGAGAGENNDSGTYFGGGGGGGGSGRVAHATITDAATLKDGNVLTITVPAGGTAAVNKHLYNENNGGKGGTASIAYGSTTLCTASGGSGGVGGTRADEGHTDDAWGGAGGAGGGGGGGGGGGKIYDDFQCGGAGGAGTSTTGGARLPYAFYGGASLGATGGGYKGTNGNSPADPYQGVKPAAGVGMNTDDYFLFKDDATGYGLYAQGGAGGSGHVASNNRGQGGAGAVAGKSAGGTTVANKFGQGGAGGKGTNYNSADSRADSSAGTKGLCGIRVWFVTPV